MKPFLSHITERRTQFTSVEMNIGSRPPIAAIVDGIRNPSVNDFMGLLRNAQYKEVKFLVNSRGDMIAWDAAQGTHTALRRGENLDSPSPADCWCVLDKEQVVFFSTGETATWPKARLNRELLRNRTLEKMSKDQNVTWFSRNP
jgi:hypothetical protein